MSPTGTGRSTPVEAGHDQRGLLSRGRIPSCSRARILINLVNVR